MSVSIDSQPPLVRLTGQQPTVELERLRSLRQRAQKLLKTVEDDLRAFQARDPAMGFLRMPTSKQTATDVNVTTTCSCLMALALDGRTREFYSEAATDAEKVFAQVFQAPWMSSGLSENNAFTTTLVLRTLGFLGENREIDRSIASTARKAWEAGLTARDPQRLAEKLVTEANPLAKTIYELMSNEAQSEVKGLRNGKGSIKPILDEIGRLVRSTVLYESARYSDADLSDATKALAYGAPNQYSAAQTNRRLIDDFFKDEIAPLAELSLAEIADRLARDPELFRINNYAASPVLLYWFVDGIARCDIVLSNERWSTLCTWAADEFVRQRSLVVAQNAVMMDPVSMAMAACLCHRLRAISREGKHGMSAKHQSELPSQQEIEQSIVELFAEQTPSGIWPKYFPLFHYQEAGSNFCFTFELLEAVLAEFGSERRLLSRDRIVQGLELAVSWCEQNRLEYVKKDSEITNAYCGWNSGGWLQSLKEEQPESWATAVVHMFLWELVETLSVLIENIILDKYNASKVDDSSLEDVLDIEVVFNGAPDSLKGTLSRELIQPYKGLSRRDLISHGPKAAVSALLFGPPGTSKTQIAKAIAAELEWPLVQIDPSHFLKSTFQNVYVQAGEVFEDMSDLSRAVVFFDEMDALVQKRGVGADAVALDTESKFLTTFMLPKLVKLHDNKRRAIFLMATNFQEQFDDAIKRAGRFDLLLCMGPPTFDEKCDKIHLFYGANTKPTDETRKAGKILRRLADGYTWTREQLSLYTYGEFKSFIKGVSPKAETLHAKLAEMKPADLKRRVKADARTVTLRFDDAAPLMKKLKVKKLAEFDSPAIELSKIKPTDPSHDGQMIRYIRDRKQSRIQA